MVVDLILDMKKLGHPSFTNLDEAAVKENAANLPEDGVPPEVVKVVERLKEEMDAEGMPMESKLQPQKAATPSEAPIANIEEAGATFSTQRPRAVVAEGRSLNPAHDVEKAALQDMVKELGPSSDLQTFEIRAGNQLLDMFRPCYWSLAFCFLFKHATAEPDVTNKFRRDWNFSPALWNYLFRTMINLQPNASKFTVANAEGRGRRDLTNDELKMAAQEIYNSMQYGMYVDINGENKAVNGDLTKLRHVPGLSAAAHKMITNLEARTRNVAGTHEVRSTMRHQTHAYRVKFGLAIFITFSPSERDSTLMVRMARARPTDPAVVADRQKAFYSREKPQLDVEFCRLSPERLAEAGPTRKSTMG